MRKFLSEFIFWIMKWEVIGPRTFPKKCIVITAPHTSNWDFLIGKCYSYIVGIKPKYLIKSELFLPILGTLFKWDGGIPVFRESENNIVKQIIQRFNNTNSLILGITPEGTRSKVNKWKSGFYHIANKARLPIVLVVLDFENKKVGVINKFFPTGNIDKDFVFIQDQYKSIKGRIPENYNPIIR